MAFESITRFANPPTNILGTTIFLSYIFLALYLTWTTSSSLYRKYYSLNRKSRHAANIRPLVLFSFISFATLSYHMLRFLITSYQRWSLNKAMFKPDDDARGPLSWMLESTLFQSFAQELVGNGPSLVWTQVALLGTWFWNVWMSGKAREHNIQPRITYAFIALGQILPISFTATLFLIFLRLQYPKRVPSQSPKKTQSRTPSKSPSPSKPQKTVAKQQPNYAVPLTISTIAFNILLLLLPTFHSSASFIPFVLLTRLFLLLPHLGVTGQRSEDELISSAMLSGGFVVANVNIITKGYVIRDVARQLRIGNAAVQALAWDAVLGAFVTGFV